jgi:hypothetical protein
MVLDPGTRLMEADDINRSTATGTPLVVTPLTGAIVALTFAQRVLYVAPAGTIAALTIRLPPSITVGSVVSISFGQIVTALTVQDGNGAAVQSTAGAVGVGIEYRFLATGWVRWR